MSLSMKSLESIHNNLGQDTIKEMEAMAEKDLKQVIVQANQAMKEVADELEHNAGYQDLREKKNAMESGKKEVDKRQKLRIKFALHLLEEKGAA